MSAQIDSSTPTAPIAPALRVLRACCARCYIDVSHLPGGARFCPGCGAALVCSDESTGRSTILRGYGAALYLLGWRYETHRNPGEALRCYHKASRLGDPSARARLGRESAADSELVQ